MAKRFSFRLEPLLKLRKSLEQDAQRQLALKIGARNDVELRLKALQEEHTQALESRRTGPGQEIDLAFWADLERYLMFMEKRIVHTRLDLETAEREVVQARLALNRAHQDHLMLLRLKERRQDQHALEILHEEIRDADETAVLRHRFGGAQPSPSPAP
ncbi:MAG: flagellar export protein FliJ [Holophaga sp.]